MNARFWVWVNGGAAKITLRPGQRLRWSKCEDTEEGYSFQSEEWIHEQGSVFRTASSGGRDCDGILSHSKDLECDIDKLRGCSGPDLDPEVWFPDWTEVSSEVYDQYARLMGY